MTSSSSDEAAREQMRQEHMRAAQEHAVLEHAAASRRLEQPIDVEHAVISMDINDGKEIDPEWELSNLDFFKEQQRRIQTSTGRFVKNPLGNSRALCWCSDGEDGISPCCIIPRKSTPWAWFIICTSIIVPLLLFELLVAPEGEIWSRVIAAVLGATCIAILLTGGTMDAGILLPIREGMAAQRPHTIMVGRNVGPVTLEVCSTCGITRPPRSSHSPTTDICYSSWDHSCGILGMNVGERTFRFFTFELIAIPIFSLFIAIRCIALAVTDTGNVQVDDAYSITRIIFVYILMLVGLTIGIIVSLPAAHYISLSGLGLSLKDEINRKRFYENERECECGRCCWRLFGPLPASRLSGGIKDWSFVSDEEWEQRDAEKKAAADAAAAASQEPPSAQAEAGAGKNE